jgi:DNA-binding IclR family transcriptional regulator
VLADVRRDGYAYCPGHIHPDALGIAVPVRDARGSVVAAVAAIVPNDDQGRTVVPVLMAAARGIGRTAPVQ